VALILDTRFLIAHAFPPSDEERRSVTTFLSRISKERLLIPSIAIVEFIKVAGTRLGAEQAGVRLRLWIARGGGCFQSTRRPPFSLGNWRSGIGTSRWQT
jgi:predicted nucleic acid-binding protein